MRKKSVLPSSQAHRPICFVITHRKKQIPRQIPPRMDRFNFFRSRFSHDKKARFNPALAHRPARDSDATHRCRPANHDGNTYELPPTQNSKLERDAQQNVLQAKNPNKPNHVANQITTQTNQKENESSANPAQTRPATRAPVVPATITQHLYRPPSQSQAEKAEWHNHALPKRPRQTTITKLSP
jgi:hypothetical protein